MVDVFLVFRNRWQRVQVGRRLQLPSPLDPLLGDLDQIADQVQELLAIRQADDQSRRHNGQRAGGLLFDPVLGDGDQLAVLSRVPQDQCVLPIFGQQSRQRLAFVRDDHDRLEPFLEGLGRLQDGFHEVDIVHFGAGLSQIRSQRRRLLIQAMALGTRQVRLVEQDRPSIHVAVLPRRLRQAGGRLLEQLLFQRNGQGRPVSSPGQAPRQEHQQPASDNGATPSARQRGP